MSGLQLSDLSLAGLRLPGLSWNVWSEAMAVQSELKCLVFVAVWSGLECHLWAVLSEAGRV